MHFCVQWTDYDAAFASEWGVLITQGFRVFKTNIFLCEHGGLSQDLKIWTWQTAVKLNNNVRPENYSSCRFGRMSMPQSRLKLNRHRTSAQACVCTRSLFQINRTRSKYDHTGNPEALRI